MRHLLSIWILLATVLSTFAGDIITGTLTVTNAANINSTNAYTIEVNSDTRTWTNSVVDASDEILASTNNATAVQRLLIHFATYPVSSLTLLSDGSTYVAWRTAESGSLAITLNTNTWGSVSYATNTVGSAVAVRVPYTVETATVKTNVANGLSDWINLAANTTGISAAKLLSGTVPLARITGLTTNQIHADFYSWIDGQSGVQSTDIDTSAELRGIVTDETGTGALVFAGGDIAAATATTASANDNDTSVATTAFVQTELTDALSDTAFAASWNGVTTVAPTKNAVYDWAHTFDTDDDGKVNVLDLTAGIAKTDGSGVLSTAAAGTDYLDPTAIDNTAYDATSWNGDTTHAPTKDAVRDKIEALVLGGGLGSGDIDTSAELRGIVTDEEGTGALIFAGGNIGAATATTPAADDNDTSVMTSAGLQTELTAYATDSVSFQSKDLTHASNTLPAEIGLACSDETTAITTGTGKVTFRMPYAMTVTAVRASVTTAPTGSTIIIDINEGGSTILSTKLSIDASEKTSTTAASAAVISDSALADDAEITIDFDQVGSTIAGAGVKVWIIGTR